MKTAVIAMITLIAALGTGSAVTLTMAAHSVPLRHAYQREFCRDFAHEVRVSPGKCLATVHGG
jgi:hypothetical protein